MNLSSESLILGIDLGTTTSMACVFREGKRKPTIIRPEMNEDHGWMPSVVCMTKDGMKVGRSARDLLKDPLYANNVVRFVKRHMRIDYKYFPTHDPQFTPAELSSHILRYLRKKAEGQLELQTPITKAVITVPAYFGQKEREQTLLAAEMAGFTRDQVGLLDEPIAAALGLNLHNHPGDNLVLVIDLGGGTLDVTLLRVGKAVEGFGFQELGRIGDDRLGGLEWDAEIAKLAFYQHNIQRPPEYLEPSNLWLFEQCEKAKTDFARLRNQAISVIWFDLKERIQLDSWVQKADFERRTRVLCERCGAICDYLLGEISKSDLAEVPRRRKGWFRFVDSRRLHRVSWQDIDHVYMVGGGSKLKAVRDAIGRRWGKEPELAKEPEYQVVYGAASSDRESISQELSLRSPRTIGYYCYPSGANGPREFGTLVKRNQRIDDLQDTRLECGVTTGNGSESELEVEFAEERIYVEPPDEPEGNGPQSNTHGKSRMRCRAVRNDIGKIRLENLPPRLPQDNVCCVSHSDGMVDEPISLRLECHNERDVSITAEFRGKKKHIRFNESSSWDEELDT